MTNKELLKRIRQEIERQREFIKSLFVEGDNSFYDGQDDAWHHILSYIDTFEEDEPELTEFEVTLLSYLSSDTKGELDAETMHRCVKARAMELLAIARKQIEKECWDKFQKATNSELDWIAAIIPDSVKYDEGYKDGVKMGRYEVEKDLPHWKPSEEQMEALEKAIVRAHSIADIPVLAELRDDLKKLKED